MTRKTTVISVLLVAVAMAAGWFPAALAEEKGELQNKITAFVEQGASESEGVVTLWMANVNPVVGVTLPFKFTPGGDSLHLDSLFVDCGRAAHFMASQPKYDEANQTLLVAMILRLDSLTTIDDAVPPGDGLLARMYFTGKPSFPVDKFRIAAIQLPPENKLMYVIKTANSVLPDFEVVRQAAPAWPPAEKGKTP